MPAANPPSAPPDLGGEALRLVMRHVPSPVTVVSAVADGIVRGVTIGSFTSASLEPPLISFNLSREGQAHPVIAAAAHFAVHVLHEHQAHLATRFALPDQTPEAQFAGVPHRLNPHGVPILDGVLAVLHCRAYAVYEAGDSDIVVGEVTAVEQQDESPHDGDRALLYQNRAYRAVGAAV